MYKEKNLFSQHFFYAFWYVFSLNTQNPSLQKQKILLAFQLSIKGSEVSKPYTDCPFFANVVLFSVNFNWLEGDEIRKLELSE